MSEKTLDNILDHLGIIFAVALVIISWFFSNLFLSVETGYQWIGYIIIVSITFLQWIYIRDGNSLDPWIVRAALMSYGYDIISNIGGWLIVFKMPMLTYIQQGNWGQVLSSMPVFLIAVGLGVFLSVLPERLLRLFITKIHMGSLLGSFGGLLESFFRPVRNYQGRHGNTSQSSQTANKSSNNNQAPQKPKTGVPQGNLPLLNMRQNAKSPVPAREYREMVMQAQGKLDSD